MTQQFDQLIVQQNYKFDKSKWGEKNSRQDGYYFPPFYYKMVDLCEFLRTTSKWFRSNAMKRWSRDTMKYFSMTQTLTIRTFRRQFATKTKTIETNFEAMCNHVDWNLQFGLATKSKIKWKKTHIFSCTFVSFDIHRKRMNSIQYRFDDWQIAVKYDRHNGKRRKTNRKWMNFGCDYKSEKWKMSS